jgi:endonuclease/exonuclease/phosphatase (EEP) superfamily protein YafD
MNRRSQVIRRASRFIAFLLVVVWISTRYIGELTPVTLALSVVPSFVWALLAVLAGLGWRAGLERKPRVWLAVLVGVWMFLEPGLPGLPNMMSEDIEVLQLNMQHGLGGHDKVAALIRKHDPDVIFLQETGPLDQLSPKGPIIDALKGYQLSNRYTLPLTGQFEVISLRGKIIRHIDVDFPEMPHEQELRGKHLTAVEAEVRGRRMILAVVHLSPTQGNLSQLAAVRTEQWRLVAAVVRAQKLPVILAGDFNAAPFGPGYRALSREATDVFRSVGVGIGNTVTATFPNRRIDYIWTRGPLMPLECEVLPDIVSDHRAVRAKIGLYEMGSD